jgi:hypothetical protein
MFKNQWTKKIEELRGTIEVQGGRILYYERLIESLKQAAQEKDNLINQFADDLLKAACSRERLLRFIKGITKYSRLE